jgi:hypothetical protein
MINPTRVSYTEQYDIKKAHFLKNMSLDEFTILYNRRDKTKKEIKDKFNKIKYFCDVIISHNSRIKYDYRYSENTHQDLGGRLYSSNGIQGVSKMARGFLASDTTDFDMKNAHPVILRYICKKHHFDCPELEYYINNRDDILLKYENPNYIKKEYLKMVNTGEHLSRTFKCERMIAFNKEMGRIQKSLLEIEEYKPILDLIPKEKKMKNLEGSFINRVLCMYENDILLNATDALETFTYEGENVGIKIFALMFDGFMIYKDCSEHIVGQKLIDYLNEVTEKEFEGLNMKWAIKPHDKTIKMPTDYKIPKVCREGDVIDEKKEKVSKDEIRNENSFEIVKTKFELNHAKIQELSLFVKKKNDTNILMSRTHLTTSYEHLKYDKIMGVSDNGKPKIKEVSFIYEWLLDKDIKIYDNIGIYPKDELCPKNIFNMWCPFAMEKEINYVHKEDELRLILNHIKILCNHQTDVYDFIIKWTADMFQNPHIKNGVMPIFIALQGSGKNTYVEMIKKMMGCNKVFESSDPSRDVWGNFNSPMKDCFFVHLEELSKKDLIEATGKVKALITNPELTINQKGISQYGIHSYHRFIATTNNEDPMPTSKDDRRNYIIRCSDEKKGDTEYFNNLYALLKDENVIKTCYEYFKNLDISDFNIKKFPSTDYHNELKKTNESPIDHWLKSLVYENFYKTDDIELLGVDIFNKFEYWKKQNGFEKYEINSVKLGVRLKNMNIKGIHKGKHTKRGETKIFKIEELKEHYNIKNVIVDDVKKDSDSDDDDD